MQLQELRGEVGGLERDMMSTQQAGVVHQRNVAQLGQRLRQTSPSDPQHVSHIYFEDVSLLFSF